MTDVITSELLDSIQLEQRVPIRYTLYLPDWFVDEYPELIPHVSHDIYVSRNGEYVLWKPEGEPNGNT